MRAIEENIYNKHERENDELTLLDPSPQLFKVVVNNYKPRRDEKPEEADEDIDATMISGNYGLPTQPARYLKYPNYDWF